MGAKHGGFDVWEPGIRPPMTRALTHAHAWCGKQGGQAHTSTVTVAVLLAAVPLVAVTVHTTLTDWPVCASTGVYT